VLQGGGEEDRWSWDSYRGRRRVNHARRGEARYSAAMCSGDETGENSKGDSIAGWGEIIRCEMWWKVNSGHEHGGS